MRTDQERFRSQLPDARGVSVADDTAEDLENITALVLKLPGIPAQTTFCRQCDPPPAYNGCRNLGDRVSGNVVDRYRSDRQLEPDPDCRIGSLTGRRPCVTVYENGLSGIGTDLKGDFTGSGR